MSGRLSPKPAARSCRSGPARAQILLASHTNLISRVRIILRAMVAHPSISGSSDSRPHQYLTNTNSPTTTKPLRRAGIRKQRTRRT